MLQIQSLIYIKSSKTLYILPNRIDKILFFIHCFENNLICNFKMVLGFCANDYTTDFNKHEKKKRLHPSILGFYLTNLCCAAILFL